LKKLYHRLKFISEIIKEISMRDHKIESNDESYIVHDFGDILLTELTYIIPPLICCIISISSGQYVETGTSVPFIHLNPEQKNGWTPGIGPR
jgi:hypothetical protein